jgi:proliferating cell nuclear antigen
MFEARLPKASLLKKILEAIKDLVTDANFDCTATGISLQAMDSAHVSLVTLLLRHDGFEHYRCDRNLSLGINLTSMANILKCAGNDDVVTIKADDNGDSVTFIFESKNVVSDFELKLIDIEGEHLGIPDMEYKAVIRMPSSQFQRICRNLTIMGDTVVISATKDGVKFSVAGEEKGNIVVKPSTEGESEGEYTQIELTEDVSLTFALRYLNFFTKATPLSNTVTLSLSPDVPLVVEYPIEELGYIKFFLAPRIDQE